MRPARGLSHPFFSRWRHRPHRGVPVGQKPAQQRASRTGQPHQAHGCLPRLGRNKVYTPSPPSTGGKGGLKQPVAPLFPSGAASLRTGAYQEPQQPHQGASWAACVGGVEIRTKLPRRARVYLRRGARAHLGLCLCGTNRVEFELWQDENSQDCFARVSRWTWYFP